MESSDTAVTLWKEFKQYLITKNIGSLREPKIQVRNAAPSDDNSPLIVFTGVEVIAQDVTKDDYKKVVSLFGYTVHKEPNYRGYKGPNPWKNEYGNTLYPDDMITFEFEIPVSETKYRFLAEGNISLGHFSRLIQPIHMDI